MKRRLPALKQTQQGLTFVELMLSIAVTSILVLGLGNVISSALNSYEYIKARDELQSELDFAFQRMIRTTLNSRWLVLPMDDKPATDYFENIRVQTEPASPPTGSSTLDTAVLAVSMPADWDLDGDGFPDADNDKDGKIDEDPGDDSHKDIAAGVWDIDDDGDGDTDETGRVLLVVPVTWDDDEEKDTSGDDDPVDGIDNDGDGAIDEDPGQDNNGDGCPGVCGVDDDGDGSVDEGDDKDDDEDGSNNEDWIDPIVYYMSGNQLLERVPVPWDQTGEAGITGQDVLINPLSNHVTRFYVERVAGVSNGPLIKLELELTSSDGEIVVSASTHIRVGGAL